MSMVVLDSPMPDGKVRTVIRIVSGDSESELSFTSGGPEKDPDGYKLKLERARRFFGFADAVDDAFRDEMARSDEDGPCVAPMPDFLKAALPVVYRHVETGIEADTGRYYEKRDGVKTYPALSK